MPRSLGYYDSGVTPLVCMGAIKRRKALRTEEERKMRIEAVVDSQKVREKSKN